MDDGLNFHKRQPNGAKRMNPRQLASFDKRMGNGCNVDGAYGVHCILQEDT